MPTLSTLQILIGPPLIVYFRQSCTYSVQVVTKFSTPDLQETTCIILIRLDVIITSQVDSYKLIEQTDVKQGAIETRLISNEDEPGLVWDGNPRKKSCLRRGRIPWDPAKIYNASILQATSVFPGNALEILLDILKFPYLDNQVELGVFSNSTEYDRLNNAGRDCAISIRYSGNQKYYISIR